MIYKTKRIAGANRNCEVCARYLIQKGHDITMFEVLHKAGGVLVCGIPEFRLPKAIVRRERVPDAQQPDEGL